jgi:hypothetical protein
MYPCKQIVVSKGMRDQDENLTTDPPRPPGTPDVDELIGESAPSSGSTGPDRREPDHDDPGHEDTASDTVAVEPPD